MEVREEKTYFSKKNAIFYTLAIVVFFLLFKHLTEIKSVARLFKEVKPIWLFIAIVAQVFTYVSLAFIYRSLILIYKDKITPTFRKVLSFSFISVFLNHTLPSGGLSGNFYIFRSLYKRGIPKAHSASVVVIESLTMYIVYLALIVGVIGGYVAFSKTSVPVAFSWAIVVGCVFYGTLMVFVSLIGRGQSLSSLAKKISRIPLIEKILKKSDQFSDEDIHLHSPWKLMREYEGTTLLVLVFQLLLVFFDVLTVYALCRGFSVDISFLKVLIGFIPAMIVGGLPLSPGSLIVYESGMTFFYVSLGVPIEIALVVTLMYRALSFWLTIPIGLLVYKKS